MDLVDIFRRHARPLEPIAADAAWLLPRLEGVRAVMFDIYGTLLISASGEVGTVRAAVESGTAAPTQALAQVVRHADGGDYSELFAWLSSLIDSVQGRALSEWTPAYTRAMAA